MKTRHLVIGAIGAGIVAAWWKRQNANTSRERVGVDMACAPPSDTGHVSFFGFQKTCVECGNCSSPDWRSFRAWSAASESLRDPSTPPSCQPPRYPDPGGEFVRDQKTCQECGNCDSPAWTSFWNWSIAREARLARMMSAEPRLGDASAGHTCWTDPDTGMISMFPSIAAAKDAAARHAGERVGFTFYDPDLAKFGNAMSPFVEMSSFKDAHLATQRPFEDRYNPRYESQNFFSEMPSLPQRPSGEDEASRAYDYLASYFADHPEIVETLMISYAGARLADGSYIDTRPPGRGLLMEGESQPGMNAVSFGLETREEANRLRAFVGDEIFGVPIVYSVREEWVKRVPRIGRPLTEEELSWGIG